MTRLPVCPELSPRERDVMEYMDTWLTWAEVAVKLNITTNTVKSHVRAIYWKLSVSSRREAIARAATIRRPDEHNVDH